MPREVLNEWVQLRHSSHRDAHGDKKRVRSSARGPWSTLRS